MRKGLLSFKPGFQPTSVLQLHPPAAATALALNAEWSVLAVGTAHGLTLYDIVNIEFNGHRSQSLLISTKRS